MEIREIIGDKLMRRNYLEIAQRTPVHSRLADERLANEFASDTIDSALLLL